MPHLKHVVLLKSKAQSTGGLEKYSSRIAAAFLEKGAKVSVLTTSSSENEKAELAIHACKPIVWPAFLRMEQFDRFVNRWIAKEKPDLIFGMDRNRHQTHFRAGNGVHIAYLKSRIHLEGKLKHWICMHNPLHLKILELEKAAFENPQLQKLFANSNMVRNEILEHYQVDPDKVKVVHNGVEWHEMQGSFVEGFEKREEIAKQLSLDPNCYYFLFVGNNYLRKGLYSLFVGLSRLKQKNVKLLVVGKDSRPKWFEAQTEKLGIRERVHFFGQREEITPFYQVADSLVIPSFYDPFANVTIEALAMGLFTVSSKQNGGHEILTPENGAIIEDLLDPTAMQEALERAVQHPKTGPLATQIRGSVKHLDFSKQLNQLIDDCG
jgi:UDP-glucose:(heptosyl)LPS alpha-1,3-glucosyltransferase